MLKHGFLSALALAATGLHIAGVAVFLLLGPAASLAADTPSKSKARAASAPAAIPKAKSAPKPKPESRVHLGDAFIAQNALRVYFARPATLSLHDARGQLLFHLESPRPAEVLPLAGLPTGFLYLTLRSGPHELTKKLVYTGK